VIIDARASGLPAQLHADIVIVGAGAAGITLALSLEDSGLDVIIVEAGSDRFDKQGQDFYRAQSFAPAAHGDVNMYRRRVLGGSTSVWGGRCIPFDAIDFEDRPWLNHARWPIGYNDVAGHYPRALEIARAGMAEFDAGHAFPGEPSDLVPGNVSQDIILDRIERFSEPTDFGRHYRTKLSVHPRIRVLTGASVEQILLSDTGAQAIGVRVRSSPDHIFTIASPRTVIATGGIETARLLLSSNEVKPGGIGNDRDLVGRFYQCHLEGELGQISFHTPRDKVRMNYERSHDGVYCRRYIWLSPAAQRRGKLAGLVLRPAHANIVDPDHGDPVLSAMYLAKNFIVPEYARKMTALEQEARRARGGTPAAYYASHIRNIILGSPRLLAFSADWTRRRVLAKRKLPSVVLESKSGVYPIDVNGEQEPNYDSRITLGNERDSSGMPRVHVDWRTTQADHQRIIAGMRTIQNAFAQSNSATISLSEEAIAQYCNNPVPVGGHHIGTARMADTPETGVCDANAQVFGTKGLFLAGAAVFPTSGFANPTLTLLALTLRLGDYLRG
jgi:choline dehydrogenase-like flavoprotein